MRKWKKIFGIGMPKTATSSLAEACRILKLKSIHFPRKNEIEKADMVNDLPVAAFYKELDKQYPNSKFILTVREQSSWESSFAMHIKLMKRRKPAPFMCECREKLYGNCVLTLPLVIETRKKHEKEVHEYFKNRTDDFMVMDIPGGDGWEKLCSFIDLPVPDIKFPHKHKTEDKMKKLKEMRE